MPRATPLIVRRAIWTAAQQGEDTASLAARFGTPQRTVRRLIRSFHDAQDQVVAPAYRPGSAAPAWPVSAVDLAHQLRAAHPTWGAGMLLVQLRRKFPDTSLPCIRTLQRWMGEAGLAPALPGRRREPRRRAEAVHEVWEVDAADQLALATGQLVSWLRLVDEYSGAVLQTVVFPPRVEQGGDDHAFQRDKLP